MKSSILPWMSTIVLLMGVAADRILLQKPTPDASSYHELVRAAADGLPLIYERWWGTDVPVPAGALALLKPNVIVCRRYDELGSGRHFQLLLVQCKDARDIIGHFPPVCYPSQGWTEVKVKREPVDWRQDSLTVNGMRYVFSTPQLQDVCVENFMILPSGRTVRDMDEVEVAAQDSRQKYFGAGQIQFVYDSNASASDRAEIFKTFLSMLRPLINQMMQRGSVDAAGESRI